ncbi:HAD-IIIC family phosphatase [Paucibacter sp. Y2R2-4]|uniref:HAD-IIIC family phosphatase n=1 Tax=Paucibacter sp. Y2R2-4 TaxID=2893553 RepID=UPI0021E35FC4|nr:HAD-IIIC family phosphatase [Paucibacter sp. Y2R2-4]MCV2349763.1 HAD-IIIC family phosphatase [Paucibacter sp. Y2R2-4]
MGLKSAITAARQLERVDKIQEAWDLLQQAIRQEIHSSTELLAAGKLSMRLAAALPQARFSFSVLILGQCTTTWLSPAISACAMEAGMHILVSDGPYDNVLQAVTAIDPMAPPDALILLPWHHRLLMDALSDTPDSIQAELDYWREVWGQALAKGVKHLIQVGYDWQTPGPLGFHLSTRTGGDIERIRRTNNRLRESTPVGSYFVSLEDISGMLGRDRFYDMRGLHWARQPFSESGLASLARHIVAGLRSTRQGPAKVLVLDLDNTLWGGVVGEVGALGIEIRETPQGEAYRAFQRHLLALSKRGVLLAVCSKNNDADAREPFLANPDMILRLTDIACFVANWEPKSEGLKQIAKVLDLSLDSFVFFDDNPFEREQIRRALPCVQVIATPEDPAEYVNVLEASLWFEACMLTDEDSRRNEMYQAKEQSRLARSNADGLGNYLDLLEMKAQLHAINDADLLRVVQLLGKTNQFNLTTKRYSIEQVRDLVTNESSVCFSLRLQDRFSDHGLVGILIAKPMPKSVHPTLFIDSFLLSCRVIGRTVEQSMMQTLIQRARHLGYQRIIGQYCPTQKNQLVATIYLELGFKLTANDHLGSKWFELRLEDTPNLKTYVSI